jgi:hypothetical protein
MGLNEGREQMGNGINEYDAPQRDVCQVSAGNAEQEIHRILDGIHQGLEVFHMSMELLTSSSVEKASAEPRHALPRM